LYINLPFITTLNSPADYGGVGYVLTTIWLQWFLGMGDRFL